MKTTEQKQTKARTRQDNRNGRTNAQQLDALNARLGTGQGAKKERKRLAD